MKLFKFCCFFFNKVTRACTCPTGKPRRARATGQRFLLLKTFRSFKIKSFFLKTVRKNAGKKEGNCWRRKTRKNFRRKGKGREEKGKGKGKGKNKHKEKFEKICVFCFYMSCAETTTKEKRKCARNFQQSKYKKFLPLFCSQYDFRQV